MNLCWNLRFKLMTNIFQCDRNRHAEGVTCYIRNDLSSNDISVFPREIESVFFEILLPYSKPITAGTIYRPPDQSKFLTLIFAKKKH